MTYEHGGSDDVPMSIIRVNETNVTFSLGGVAHVKIDVEINLPAIVAFDHMNRIDSLNEHLGAVLSPLFDEIRQKHAEIVKGLQDNIEAQGGESVDEYSERYRRAHGLKPRDDYKKIDK